MLSFAQPILLWGLLGLALPLLAHLVNRSRALPLRFPSVRFITPSNLPRDKRRSLRDILLLLLRLGLLALAILALAGPQWTPEQAATPAEKGRERVVLLLDASASMAGWDAWTDAREVVEAELSRNAAGLVLFDEQVLATLPPEGETRHVRQLLDDIEPGQLTGKPAPAIEAALDLLGSEGPRRLVIISDFQGTTWQGAALPAAGEDVAVELQQVGNFTTPNAALLNARAYPASEGMLRVLARVRNDAPEPWDITLSLSTTGDTQSQTLSFAPGQTQTFAFLVPEPENLLGELELQPDAYAADNTYQLWLGMPLPADVLTLLPSVDEPEKLNEVAFVQKALQARRGDMPPSFALSGAAPDFDLAANAPLVEVLYLPGTTAYLDAPQLEQIRAYLEAGGVVLMTPGEAAPRQFRLLRENGLTETAFMGRPGRHGDRREPFRIAPLQPGNPLSGVFDGESAQDLALTELYQYIKLRPSDSADILLETEDGDPLLLRESVGRGQLIISALGFDPSWSDLPLRNAFLPILREVLSQTVEDDTVVELAVGDPLPPELQSQGDPNTALLTSAPGVAALGEKILQVNVSRTESSTQLADLSDLRAQLTRESTRRAAAEPTTRTIQLWPWLALGALVLLLIESALSAPPAATRKVQHA